MDRNYIVPKLQQASKIEFLFPQKEDDVWWYIQNENKINDIDFDALIDSKNKHYMIVAEPGYGKTRLLKEIVIASKEKYKTFFIDAKKIKQHSIMDIIKKCRYKEFDSISEEELQKLSLFKNNNIEFKDSDDIIVCIDALDEVAINTLYELLENIEEFAYENNHIKIFLSCRTHHLKKISYDFLDLDLTYITLASFSRQQIEQYLNLTNTEKSINLKELCKKSKTSNLIDFISTPRYLYYYSLLLNDYSLDEIILKPKTEIFDYFVYRKLNKELKKDTPQNQIDLLKRVLEKLAFIMKLKGVSEITKDELMSIFEKMDSNFSQIAFRDNLVQKMYDKSLIKDNVEAIEFENKEFLDYLSAKELARFEKTEQVLFDVAMEPNLLEIYPDWFKVLPFVFELKPSIINIFLNFLENNQKRVVTKEYFEALLSVEPKKISKEAKSKIFDIVFDYHLKHSKWLDSFSGFISRSLIRFYDDSKYEKIKVSIDGRKYRNDKLLVTRTNAIRLIALLIEDNKLNEKEIKFWQDKVTSWLKLSLKENRYLHSNILNDFDKLSNGNFEWIKKHRFIFEKGIQVQNEYARACFKVAPNDKFSIDIYLDKHKVWNKNKIDKYLSDSNDEYDYILEISNPKSMQYALEKIWKDKLYYHLFCENLDRGIYKDTKIEDFKDNLLLICNDDLRGLFKRLVSLSISKENIFRNKDCYGIYKIFTDVILQKDKSYIYEFIDDLKNNFKESMWIFYDSFLNYISIKWVDKYFDDFNKLILSQFGEEEHQHILRKIYNYASNKEVNSLKNKIIKKYPKLFNKNNITNTYENNLIIKICKQWKEKLSTKTNNVNNNLFEYFIYNKESLIKCDNYKNNYELTIKKAKNIVKNNPLKIKNTINEYCIKFIEQEKIELSQIEIDNIFRYLPFAYTDCENVLLIANNPSLEAVQDVANYVSKSDKLEFYVRQFIKVYKHMKLPQFEKVILQMLKNDKIKEYEKIYILQSLPKGVLSVDEIQANQNKLEKGSKLYKEYLAILVREHKNKDAINEAFDYIKRKAKNIGNRNDIFTIDNIMDNVSLSISNIDYSIEKDKEFLLLSSNLSSNDRVNGGDYLRKIVENHLKYIVYNKKDAYKTLLEIEKFLEINSNKKYLHWFEYTLQDIKKMYLEKAKDKNIIYAIKKYNELSNKDYLDITSVYELQEIIIDVLDTDIRRWVEAEGAYKYLNELAQKKQNKNAEEFIQKTIKSQIELSLLKKGFRKTDFSIIREEQLLDDKRLDFTIRYGYIGSVMLELKLGHNSEAQASTTKGKEYLNKLKKYMLGTSSEYGLFVILNIKTNRKDKFKKQILELNELYENEKNISVIGLDCVI